MEWQDEGIVLHLRRHGETALIVTLLTRLHGRHAGLIHGGIGKALRSVAQVGNQVRAVWKARLPDQLGTFTLEPAQSFAVRHLDDPGRLAALSSVAALCESTLVEHQPFAPLYDSSIAFLTSLDFDSWPSVYVHWELALLRALGFGLDLASCAATGSNDNLAYVSPKSGRAVSLSAGYPYRAKLLALPRFLLTGEEGQGQDIRDGLALTGYFLEMHAMGGKPYPLPAARMRLVDRFQL